jgi:hypothetical protein
MTDDQPVSAAPVERDALEQWADDHFRPVRPEPGVWAAYYPDDSAVAVFATEIDALRAAVDRSMAVVFWPYGMDLNEARREKP